MKAYSVQIECENVMAIEFRVRLRFIVARSARQKGVRISGVTTRWPSWAPGLPKELPSSSGTGQLFHETGSEQ